MKNYLRFPASLALLCFLTLCSGCGSSSSHGALPPNAVTPQVLSISPKSVPAGGSSFIVTITGSGFDSNSTVQVGGVSVQATLVSPTEITASVPASAISTGGTLTVVVSNGSLSSPPNAPAAGLEIDNPSPTLTSLSPASALLGSAPSPVTINGTGFNLSSSVQVNGTLQPVNYVSATRVTWSPVSSNLAAAGSLSITVTNPPPGGRTSSPLSFAVNNPVPVLTAANPASVTAGSGALTLDITGTGFLSSSAVNLNGSALTTTVLNSTELKAFVPASATTTAGIASLTITNPTPGGGASTAIPFNVNSPTPVLSSVSPRNVSTGAQITVTLYGSGFETNSVVQWNGVAHTPTVVSSSVLQVVLTAVDLANSGTGSLIVTNPDPNGSSSTPLALNVTSYPIPSITNVSITAPRSPGVCPQLLATFTGTNLAVGSVVQVNGKSVGRLGLDALNGVYLPVGLVAQPGALSFTVVPPYQSTLVSDPFPYPTTSPTVLALCATPSPTTVFLPSNFTFTVTPSEVNATGNETLATGALPAGITISTSTVPLSATGTQLHLQAGSTVAAGSYTIPLTGTAGTATASGSIALTVSTSAAPGFGFVTPVGSELAISPGSSGSLQFTTVGDSTSSIDYDLVPSVHGLPAGVTASFSPAVFSPGQGVTVTLSAAANAPLAQNVTITLTGTPSAAASPASVSFILDVAQPPGSLPTSRTDFTPVAGTPFAAAYDAGHGLIFASNPVWNRVDVLSATTHQVIKHIPVFSPRGMDITQDNATVWVQTAGRYIYAINTSTLQATQYSLPKQTFGSSGLPPGINTHDFLLALSDGTLFLYFDDAWVGGSAEAGVFNPATGQLNVFTGTSAISTWTVPVRSGDGTRVFASSNTYGSGMEVYDVATRTLKLLGSGTIYGNVQAVNRDGSVVVLSTFGNTTYGSAAYDANLAYLGSLPCGPAPSAGSLNGGILFSADGSRAYEICPYQNQTVVLTLDSQTFKFLGAAPAQATDAVATSGDVGISVPFGVDSTGLIFGLQNYGIGFEDATFTQNYVATLPSHNGETEYIAAFGGPLSGGTDIAINPSSLLTPDVWFGQTRGTVQRGIGGNLAVISPPTQTAGVVNLKYNFPDGVQWFYPQIFSYGTNPEYAVTSGSGPNGGAAAQVLGYGLPDGVGAGTVTIGGNNATVTTTQGQYPAFSGEPYPSTLLAYTFPAGKPGWADLQVTTPNGTGTLPKSIFYANSVTDYASSDTFTHVLYDGKRNQVYLSAGDHIDVFSLASNSFVSPLIPAALGPQRQFTGLALTPDGSKLLAADLLDGSLAIINPDAPSSTSAIAIAAPTKLSPTCTQGPLYVASAAGSVAFVSIGGMPSTGCPSSGTFYAVNLLTSTQIPTTNMVCDSYYGADGVDATSDGATVFIPSTGRGSCFYSASAGTYTAFKVPAYYGGPFGTISGRGNVLFNNDTFGNSTGDTLAILASPIPYYGAPNAYKAPVPLLRPRLNASGSLLYIPYANWVDIIDVAHASLRMRFGLKETLPSTPGPIAIDSGGRWMFLITNSGLTVVDLGAAPLSIGSVHQQLAGVGSQITLFGSGFDAQTSAKVGGLSALITYIDENTLALAMPAASPGPQDVTLTRGDGTTYTLENAVLLH